MLLTMLSPFKMSSVLLFLSIVLILKALLTDERNDPVVAEFPLYTFNSL